MARQVQIRRGSSTECDAFTGVVGELFYDTTNKRLRISDGSTAGGIVLPKYAEVMLLSALDTDSSLSANSDALIASQKAVKSYVDNTAANLAKKFASVRAATTANITISTALNNGDTLDGVTLATGDRVLVKDQSTASQNGIYVVGASPARATDFDTYNEHPGSLVTVEEGTANADTLWLCTSDNGGTLDTTAINWTYSPPLNAATLATAMHAASGKTTPVDADELALIDSAASNVLKKLTWANLKATLKTYFDTIYASLAGAVFTAAIQVTTIEVGHASDTTVGRNAAGRLQVEGVALNPEIPINSYSAAHTSTLAEANTALYHPTTDDNARTFTIDSNANVAYPVGTFLMFINDKNTLTIAITSDTLVLANTAGATTGSRTLANGGMAVAVKVTSTRWLISGVGLT